MAIDARRIMDGTYGEVWLDDKQISECKGLQAKIEFQRKQLDIKYQELALKKEALKQSKQKQKRRGCKSLC